MKWWERDSGNLGFFGSHMGAIRDSVFWICIVHAEIEPFSMSFFFIRKRATRLGFGRFVWSGVGLWSRILLVRWRARFISVVQGSRRGRAGFEFGLETPLVPSLVNANSLFNHRTVSRGMADDCHPILDLTTEAPLKFEVKGVVV